jgi:predicted PurR-regulated permease PerM
VILIAVLIGASLLGVLGALVAIPTAAAIQAVVRDWWHFRQGAEPPPADEPPAAAGAAAPAEG